LIKTQILEKVSIMTPGSLLRKVRLPWKDKLIKVCKMLMLKMLLEKLSMKIMAKLMVQLNLVIRREVKIIQGLRYNKREIHCQL